MQSVQSSQIIPKGNSIAEWIVRSGNEQDGTIFQILLPDGTYANFNEDHPIGSLNTGRQFQDNRFKSNVRLEVGNVNDGKVTVSMIALADLQLNKHEGVEAIGI